MMKDVLSADDSAMLFPDQDGVFLQALPHNDPLNLIDITHLRVEADLPSHQIIDKLLAGENLETTLTGLQHTIEKLRNNYFEDRNSQRLIGEPSLGIGFPIFLKEQDGNLIAAPLFIWQCWLEPDVKSGNNWHFSFAPYGKSAPNATFLDWLKNTYDFVPESISADPLKSPELTAEKVLAFANELSVKFELNNPGESISLMPFPTLEEIKQIENPGAICWSAVLGSFPAYPRQAESDLSWPATTTYEKSRDAHPFGLLVKDPWQAAAMDGALRYHSIIVEGEAGTGKTALLIDLILNALSNGQKVLVVSKSLSALQENQQLLAGHGLENYTFLMRKRLMDQVLLSEMLRAGSKSKEEAAAFDMNAFTPLRDKLEREKKKLDEKHHALTRTVFGKADWAQTVGLFLSANRIEGKELLNNQLNTNDFKFNPTEFKTIRSAVDSCFQLFKRINTLSHPLRNLNAGIFVHHGKEEGQEFVKRQTALLQKRATALQYHYISSQTEYGDRLTDHYESYYRDLIDRINVLRDHIEDYVVSYGEDTLRSAKGTLKFYGLFSEKYQAALQAQQTLSQDYQSLQKQFNQYNYLEHQFLSAKERKNIAKLRQNLVELEQSLLNWREALGAALQEEQLRLSRKTVHAQTGFSERIIELEEELDLFTDELNASGLYQLPLENKMLTLTKRQRFLEEIIDQLETTQLNLRDFPAFYDWQYHWFGLPEEARRVVKALVKVRPNNWGMAFESWYFNNALGKAYDPALPTRDFPLARYQELMTAFTPLLRLQIPGFSQQRREAALKKAKRKKTAFSEKLLGKKELEPEEVGAVLGKNLDLVTEYFPVILATPAAATDLLVDNNMVIDLVIVDEAQDFPTQWAELLLHRSRRLVQFSNPAFENEKTTFFVATAKVNGTPVFTLEKYYRNYPADLQRLSDNTTNEALQPSVNFEQLDGRYLEEKQTNEEEAQHILRLLNQIQETPQRTYPSVGIVCFTQAQRNLIAGYLLKIKQQRSPGVEKIQQLERNGLGVYHIEELSGQHFDIVLVSCTIGPNNLGGMMTNHLSYFQQYRFTSFLRQLASRAAQSTHFINSIPESYLSRAGKSPMYGSSATLLAYLAYAATQGKQDLKGSMAIRQHFVSRKDDVEAHPLAEEIAWRLATLISTERLRLNKQEGDVRLPLVIASKQSEKPSLAILIDGFFGESDALDYNWEFQRRQFIQQQGFQLLPVWSALWWKNPKMEIEQLLSAIDKPERAVEEEE